MSAFLLSAWSAAVAVALLLVEVHAGGENFQNRYRSNLVAQYLFTDAQTTPGATTAVDSVCRHVYFSARITCALLVKLNVLARESAIWQHCIVDPGQHRRATGCTRTWPVSGHWADIDLDACKLDTTHACASDTISSRGLGICRRAVATV